MTESTISPPFSLLGVMPSDVIQNLPMKANGRPSTFNAWELSQRSKSGHDRLGEGGDHPRCQR